MRDIYINRKELELKSNPKCLPMMTPVLNPELFINPSMKVLRLPQSYSSSMDMGVSAIVCKLLLVNKYRDGIWLVMEDDKSKISIPGGHVSEYEWNHYNRYPYNCIVDTIVREMVEEHPMLDITVIDTFSNSPEDALVKVISEYGFTINQSVEFPLFYTYGSHDNVNYRDLIIYLVKEVDFPNQQRIPDFSNYTVGRTVWYSRKEHSINKRYSRDRRGLYCSPYDNDIRIDDEGVELLDKIFSTEKLFGKIDIY